MKVQIKFYLKKSCFVGSVARIFNGQDTVKNEFPFIVALIGIKPTTDEENPDVFVCAGTILNATTILTAASCFYDAWVNISKIRIHLFDQNLF